MTPDAKLRFIGWYSDHAIRIYEDGDDQPWLVVFDSIPLVNSDGTDTGASSKFHEARERTESAAKRTALALAQNSYLRHLRFQDHIEWRPL